MCNPVGLSHAGESSPSHTTAEEKGRWRRRPPRLERAEQALPRNPVPPPSEAPTASGQSCLDDLKDVDWIGPEVLLDVPAYETETLNINMYARDC